VLFLGLPLLRMSQWSKTAIELSIHAYVKPYKANVQHA
jgi:hypothetical protein